jgi:hypothetical protein
MVRAHPRRRQKRVFITHADFCSIPRVREIIFLISVAFQLTSKTLDKGVWELSKERRGEIVNLCAGMYPSLVLGNLVLTVCEIKIDCCERR